MTDPSPSTGPLPPPPDGSNGSVLVEPTPGVLPTRTPRAGELSVGWRIVTVLTWIAVVLAFAVVWNVSVQLGLSTRWLGPRAQPRPRAVQLTPFIVPVLMLLGTINNVRWLGRWGVGAAAVLAAYGIADLGRVASIAALELLIAGSAAAVSIASLTGTYRAAAGTGNGQT
ncbi:MAG: hypothetical protein OEZ14_11650, partial [Acidimicrobiia bacterium]|nr:hypothetical protein [Acidimicrobiia bacterium]